MGYNTPTIQKEESFMTEKPNAAATEKVILELLDRQIQSIWDGDVATYRATTAADCSFFEWYICPHRIDGLDFHIRELSVHRQVLEGSPDPLEEKEHLFEHEILQPRVQVYDKTAIVSFTFMVRAVLPEKLVHKSHNETRVYHNFGTDEVPEWKLVHCHKSPVVTRDSLDVLRI
jgi:hypothetical protein